MYVYYIATKLWWWLFETNLNIFIGASPEGKNPQMISNKIKWWIFMVMKNYSGPNLWAQLLAPNSSLGVERVIKTILFIPFFESWRSLGRWRNWMIYSAYKKVNFCKSASGTWLASQQAISFTSLRSDKFLNIVENSHSVQSYRNVVPQSSLERDF